MVYEGMSKLSSETIEELSVALKQSKEQEAVLTDGDINSM